MVGTLPLSWVYATVPNQQWSSVVYAGELFVAVSITGTNRIYTSPDGFTWTARPSVADGYPLSAITYGNGLYVILSSSRNGPPLNVFTSPDGINWTQTVTNMASGSSFFTGIAYGNGLYVIGGNYGGGTTAAITSSDTINWTVRTGKPSTTDYYCITFANDMFVQGGRYIWASPDPTNWTGVPTITPSGTMNYINSVSRGDNGTWFIAGSGGVNSSTDNFATWTGSQLPGYQTTTGGYGSGLFLYLPGGQGGGSPCYVSTDAITWTPDANLFYGTLQGYVGGPQIAWGNGTFVVAGVASASVGGIATALWGEPTMSVQPAMAMFMA